MAEPRKARLARGVAGAALCLSLTTAPALAERVPLPKPRPIKQHVAAAVAPVQRPLTTGSIVSKPSIPPEALVARAQATPSPVTNPFAALLGQSNSNKSALTPEQRAIVDKVNAYLSNVQTLTGNFVQVGPDGKRTTGDFYIQKPGKIRFEYDDPSPIALVADGSSVIVRDRRLATQDVYPLSQTPLRYLLSDRIDLMRDTNVVGVAADDMFISVTIEEKQTLVGTSRLMLMIGAKDNQLKQWTVTDPQGYDTTIAVYNLDTTKKLDPAMFKIDFTTYPSTPPG